MFEHLNQPKFSEGVLLTMGGTGVPPVVSGVPPETVEQRDRTFDPRVLERFKKYCSREVRGLQVIAAVSTRIQTIENIAVFPSGNALGSTPAPGRT